MSIKLALAVRCTSSSGFPLPEVSNVLDPDQVVAAYWLYFRRAKWSQNLWHRLYVIGWPRRRSEMEERRKLEVALAAIRERFCIAEWMLECRLEERPAYALLVKGLRFPTDAL
jgi:hypothetical protein